MWNLLTPELDGHEEGIPEKNYIDRGKSKEQVKMPRGRNVLDVFEDQKRKL
jgi:hypothetical protein